MSGQQGHYDGQPTWAVHATSDCPVDLGIIIRDWSEGLAIIIRTRTSLMMASRGITLGADKAIEPGSSPEGKLFSPPSPPPRAGGGALFGWGHKTIVCAAAARRTVAFRGASSCVPSLVWPPPVAPPLPSPRALGAHNGRANYMHSWHRYKD